MLSSAVHRRTVTLGRGVVVGGGGLVEMDRVGRRRRAVASVTQHRRGTTQARHDRHVQRQDDDERRDRVGRQLDVLERSVHELFGHDARTTLRLVYQRTVFVSHCMQTKAPRRLILPSNTQIPLRELVRSWLRTSSKLVRAKFQLH